MKAPTAVGLVPARSGSKRVSGKNVRVLGGHPVLAYTIAAAKASGVFGKVVISTEDEQYAAIAKHYGAEAPFLRPAALAGDLSPDIEWVEHAIEELARRGDVFDCFSILRPTSPFRRAATIQRAWDTFLKADGADSLRAVEKCKQHPGKMWVVRNGRMYPLLPLSPGEQPWHSSQYQTLPEVFAQNASLEIAWTRVVRDQRTIAGVTVAPFFTEGMEGVDVNDERDWDWAERIVAKDPGILERVHQPAFRTRP